MLSHLFYIGLRVAVEVLAQSIDVSLTQRRKPPQLD